MTRSARFLVLLAGICLALQADYSAAQKPAPRKPVYDQYEPSKVRRTRKQECLRDEEPSGAYCVRLCQKGSLPGPIRRETGSQPKLPGSDKPTKPSGQQ
jgi:hypothetical protein